MTTRRHTVSQSNLAWPDGTEAEVRLLEGPEPGTRRLIQVVDRNRNLSIRYLNYATTTGKGKDSVLEVAVNER